jgi:hypothetical protein
VDRENRIILEYRAKNAYRVEYMGPAGQNLFRFRVLNGFDEIMTGLTVYARAYAPDAPYLVDDGGNKVSSRSYVTDGRSEFLLALYEPQLPPDGKVEIAVRAGNNEQIFPLNGSAVPSPSYTYVFNALTVDASGNLSGTVKVTNNNYGGHPAFGVAVTLSYATYDKIGASTGTAVETTINLGLTDVDGEVSLVGQNVTALVRSILFTANNDSSSAVTGTVGTMPNHDDGSFLTGRSLDVMNWFEGNAYCAFHGGRLPRIGTPPDDPKPIPIGLGVAIEGFGAVGGSWPSHLPGGVWPQYWSGTKLSPTNLGMSWAVGELLNVVFVDVLVESEKVRVACVP